MSWESLVGFNLLLAAALVSPGAAFLMAVKSTMAHGRRAGLLTGLGLASMAILWTLAAFLGLQTVFALFPWAFTVLKTIGALYLIWLAVQTWRHARTRIQDTQIPDARAFMSGVLVNLGNPKSVLFAAAVILVVFPEGLDLRFVPLILINQFLLEIAFYGIIALILSGASARRGYLALKPAFDRVAAILLGAFGARLLMER